MLKSDRLPYLRIVLGKISVRKWVTLHLAAIILLWYVWKWKGRQAGQRRKRNVCKSYTLGKKKRVIQTFRGTQWLANNGHSTLGQKGWSIYCHLRTTRNSLNKYMPRMCVAPTLPCSCKSAELTVEQVLQGFPDYCELRKKYWPTVVVFNHKLYRNKEELQTTGWSWKQNWS